MAKKYELIGCRYDKYADKKYQNEEVIKIDGIKLDSLEAIDYFTTEQSFVAFEKIMMNIYPNKNLFSIRVTDTRNESNYFLKPIYGDAKLHDLLEKTVKKTIDTLAGKRSVNLVPLGEEIVYKTFSPIKDALREKNYDKIRSLINTRSSFMFEMERFCGTSYDEGLEDTDLLKIEREFCDYPVFRDAYFPRIKKKVANLAVRPNKVSTFQNNISVDKEPKEAVVENLMLLNQGEKEEFLSAEEYQKTYGDNASYLGEGKKWRI